ncbi:hypothetical protein FOCC_FOCC015476 [Frankliniella occidentalis]|uniref:RUN domain-containing protein 1 n=1 Tax=Frankliniella occidentalis TaxID=133901 RepID=A0A6J1RZU1_FRAOC|nr:RUN domain-containing protein 1 [Frankliniella occidentalis]KAE8739031.1 hypothetical protein FOCC_FOCC015476 [Frankliniella occidentalis]
MMEEVSISGEEAEGFDLYDGKPSGERWAPVGASELDDEAAFESIHDANCYYPCESPRTRELEEQLDVVNSSLIALTSHFAQVQFRLRQIVDAPVQDKDVLLKDLEQFAFRGIPEVKGPQYFRKDERDNDGDRSEEYLSQQREKQKELIQQLKQQLEDLEKYAYETGEAGLPQSVLLERQKLLIDELKGKLNLNVDDIAALSPDDLKKEVEEAVGELINPLKVKEQLVNQLKTQISDLERFVEFLQGEAGPDEAASNTTHPKCTCHSRVHTESCAITQRAKKARSWQTRQQALNGQEDKIREKTLNIMRKAAVLMQIFAVSQFGCGQEVFHKNTMKKNMKVNHWGDLRARLEVAVAQVSEIMMEAAESQSGGESEDYASDSEGAPVVMCNARITSAVRKKLAMTIKELMEHGLTQNNQNMSLVPLIGCFPVRGPAVKEKPLHAWELILAYYDLKNGESYNSTPARRLSQSFNLELVGGVAVSNKQQLLSTVGNIISSHTRYKRSYDSHFKAFVCAGLNSKKLVYWLRLILHCQPIIEAYYQPWSYVCKTGFEDTLQTLEKLKDFEFELPVDLAVRQFQNIKDAF